MNKGILFFLLLILLSGIVICLYMFVPEVQIAFATYTEDAFTDGNIYSDLESVSARLEEEILNGSESFTIYTKDLDVNALGQINESVEGTYGSGGTYTVSDVPGTVCQKVTITIKHTINYYAMQAYLHQTTIPDTEPKAKQLYKVIKHILDTQITEGMSDYEKELALHDYLITHCKYSENTAQPSDSDIYRAYGALVNQDAVCNGYAEALQLLFACVGIQSKFVVGTADGVDHAWNLVNIDNKWYHLDATWDDPIPDQGEKVLHPYFNVSDAIMGQNHTWEHENYPAAYSMDANYYKMQNSYFNSFDTYKTGAYDIMINNATARYEAVIENYRENEEDMQFLFEGNHLYNNLNWQTFKAGNYLVLVMEAE